MIVAAMFESAPPRPIVVLSLVVLQLICNQTPRFTIGDCAAGHRADNRDKNRNVLIVPRKFLSDQYSYILQDSNNIKKKLKEIFH